jgi:hypothetical protein
MTLRSVATCASIATLLFGCTVLTDDEPLDDAGRDGGDATVSDGGASSCAACLFEHCLGPSAVCDDAMDASSGACAAKRACELATVCAGGCSMCSLDAGPDAGAVGDCGTPDADVMDADASTADAALDADDASDGSSQADCGACVSAQCSSEAARCGPASACEWYALCVSSCVDSACVNACGADAGSGKSDLDALAACVSTRCTTPCGT